MKVEAVAAQTTGEYEGGFFLVSEVPESDDEGDGEDDEGDEDDGSGGRKGGEAAGGDGGESKGGDGDGGGEGNNALRHLGKKRKPPPKKLIVTLECDECGGAVCIMCRFCQSCGLQGSGDAIFGEVAPDLGPWRRRKKKKRPSELLGHRRRVDGQSLDEDEAARAPKVAALLPGQLDSRLKPFLRIDRFVAAGQEMPPIQRPEVVDGFGCTTWSWGCGEQGRLGLGHTAGRKLPTLVHKGGALLADLGRLGSDPLEVSAGGRHSLILLNDGQVLSFGHAREGQVGIGKDGKQEQLEPGRVEGLLRERSPAQERVIHVAAGGTASYLLTAGGDVLSFGDNAHGQLGLGHFDPTGPRGYTHRRPRFVPLLRNRRVVQLSAGNSHVLALTLGGAIFSWGSGGNGRLGHGDAAARASPTLVEELRNVSGKGLGHAVYVSAGAQHSLAVVDYFTEPHMVSDTRYQRVVFAWGRGDARLGLGKGAAGRAAESTMGGTRFARSQERRKVQVGADYRWHLADRRAFKTWQDEKNAKIDAKNARAQSKLDPRLYELIESRRPGAAGCEALRPLAGRRSAHAAATEHTSLDGITRTRPDASFADGWYDADQLVPMLVPGSRGKEIYRVSAGLDHNLALGASGPSPSYGTYRGKPAGGFQMGAPRVWAWGGNAYGQLGVQHTVDVPGPDLVEVASLRGKVQQVSAGHRFSLAVTTTGEVYSWGYGRHGETGHGDSTVRIVPYTVRTLAAAGRRVQMVSAGASHSLAIATAGFSIRGKPTWVQGAHHLGISLARLNARRGARAKPWLQPPIFVFKPGSWCRFFKGIAGEMRPVHRKGPRHACSICHPKRFRLLRRRELRKVHGKGYGGEESSDDDESNFYGGRWRQPEPVSFNEKRPNYTEGLSLANAHIVGERRRQTPAIGRFLEPYAVTPMQTNLLEDVRAEDAAAGGGGGGEAKEEKGPLLESKSAAESGERKTAKEDSHAVVQNKKALLVGKRGAMPPAVLAKYAPPDDSDDDGNDPGKKDAKPGESHWGRWDRLKRFCSPGRPDSEKLAGGHPEAIGSAPPMPPKLRERLDRPDYLDVTVGPAGELYVNGEPWTPWIEDLDTSEEERREKTREEAARKAYEDEDWKCGLCGRDNETGIAKCIICGRERPPFKWKKKKKKKDKDKKKGKKKGKKKRGGGDDGDDDDGDGAAGGGDDDGEFDAHGRKIEYDAHGRRIKAGKKGKKGKKGKRGRSKSPGRSGGGGGGSDDDPRMREMRRLQKMAELEDAEELEQQRMERYKKILADRRKQKEGPGGGGRGGRRSPPVPGSPGGDADADAEDTYGGAAGGDGGRGDDRDEDEYDEDLPGELAARKHTVEHSEVAEVMDVRSKRRELKKDRKNTVGHYDAQQLLKLQQVQRHKKMFARKHTVLHRGAEAVSWEFNAKYLQAIRRMYVVRRLYPFWRLLGRVANRQQIDVCRRGFPKFCAMYRGMVVRRTYRNFCGRVYKIAGGCSMGSAGTLDDFMHAKPDTDRMYWLLGIWQMKQGEVQEQKHHLLIKQGLPGRALTDFRHVSSEQLAERDRLWRARRDACFKKLQSKRRCRARRMEIQWAKGDWVYPPKPEPKKGSKLHARLTKRRQAIQTVTGSRGGTVAFGAQGQFASRSTYRRRSFAATHARPAATRFVAGVFASFGISFLDAGDSPREPDRPRVRTKHRKVSLARVHVAALGFVGGLFGGIAALGGDDTVSSADEAYARARQGPDGVGGGGGGEDADEDGDQFLELEDDAARDARAEQAAQARAAPALKGTSEAQRRGTVMSGALFNARVREKQRLMLAAAVREAEAFCRAQPRPVQCAWRVPYGPLRGHRCVQLAEVFYGTGRHRAAAIHGYCSAHNEADHGEMDIGVSVDQEDLRRRDKEKELLEAGVAAKEAEKERKLLEMMEEEKKAIYGDEYANYMDEEGGEKKGEGKKEAEGDDGKGGDDDDDDDDDDSSGGSSSSGGDSDGESSLGTGSSSSDGGAGGGGGGFGGRRRATRAYGVPEIPDHFMAASKKAKAKGQKDNLNAKLLGDSLLPSQRKARFSVLADPSHLIADHGEPGRGIPRVRGSRLSVMAQIGTRINTQYRRDQARGPLARLGGAGGAGARRPSAVVHDNIWERLQKLK